MTSSRSWKSGYVYCGGTNVKGEPCGNKIPKGFTRCYAHKGQK